jgi:hypothetical protein
MGIRKALKSELAWIVDMPQGKLGLGGLNERDRGRDDNGGFQSDGGGVRRNGGVDKSNDSDRLKGRSSGDEREHLQQIMVCHRRGTDLM